MSTSNVKESLIDGIKEYVCSHHPEQRSEAFLQFISYYFVSMTSEDMVGLSHEVLYNVVNSHWNYLHNKKPKSVKLRLLPVNNLELSGGGSGVVLELVIDDMPFIVDSVRMRLRELNYTITSLINVGGINLRRNDQGNLVEFIDKPNKGTLTEAYLRIELSGKVSEKFRLHTIDELNDVLEDIRYAVEDWHLMQDKIQTVKNELDGLSSCERFKSQDIKEIKSFLSWLIDYFTFFGMREYVVDKKSSKLFCQLGSPLGVLRRAGKSQKKSNDKTPHAAHSPLLALSNEIVTLSKTNTKSSIHRPAYTDYIHIKRFNKAGKEIGEIRCVGLLTSDAYESDPTKIPLIRRKVSSVLEHSKLLRSRHASKRLLHILKTLPRDELFQACDEELSEISEGIYGLQERSMIKIFVRYDVFNRFVSCLVYLPKEKLNTELRLLIQAYLQEVFQATTIGSTPTFFNDSILARIHYVIRFNVKIKKRCDVDKVEEEIRRLARSWEDKFKRCLYNHETADKAKELYQKYYRAFQEGYKESNSPQSAQHDVFHIERLSDDHKLEINFYASRSNHNGRFGLKLYQLGEEIPLSDILPTLENMGMHIISEQSHIIVANVHNLAYVSNITLQCGDCVPTNQALTLFISNFQNCFYAVRRHQVDDDLFNQLILVSGLNHRQVNVLRAYVRYMKQIGFLLSESYIAQTLIKYGEISKLMLKVFEERFAPMHDVEQTSDMIADDTLELAKLIDGVESLDEDRILKLLLQLILATLRTNFYQRDVNNNEKPYISFKINPRLVEQINPPLSYRETYVYSLMFEGIHIRMGKVARGGIRWSDRMEDYRTEVLGLAETQRFKNAVIVPTGAKGGFIIRQNNGDRIVGSQVEHHYQNFIRGLIELTDNIGQNGVIKPKNVVCYDDEDDTYMVVAADKGTSMFSNLANNVSDDYGYWLRDAFASGGRVGYDHKKLAITARGVWESVKWHFKALQISMKASFTVIGIGDMGGDVFGNGMLLSPHIKLVAAFNHNSIFIDPTPNVKNSYRERKRLFSSKDGSWQQYDDAVISTGGGVFKRSSKKIRLSPQIKKLLGLNESVATPNELIQSILCIDADLLWNGGIGNFVKASSETHQQVADHFNDTIRVDASDLRCKVIAEGGNLGLTQAARTEFELHGGLINTDFIDNSAGVDCSDHEVNIKIALNELTKLKRISKTNRNKYFMSMSDDVCEIVLETNLQQNITLSVASEQCVRQLGLYLRYIEQEEAGGFLDRALLCLPNQIELAERKSLGGIFSRAELAVMMTHVKNRLYDEIITSPVCQSLLAQRYLALAFPEKLVSDFGAAIDGHILKSEIIASRLSNLVVDDMGIITVYQLQQEFGVTISYILYMYMLAREILDISTMRQTVMGHDNHIVQIHIQKKISKYTRRVTRWLIANKSDRYLELHSAKQFISEVALLTDAIEDILTEEEIIQYEAECKELVAMKISVKVANKIAILPFVYPILNIIQDAKLFGELDRIFLARLFYKVADFLQIDWLRELINERDVDGYWSLIGNANLRAAVDTYHRQIVYKIYTYLQLHAAADTKLELDQWIGVHAEHIDAWKKTLVELKSVPSIDYIMLSVVVDRLKDLSVIGD